MGKQNQVAQELRRAVSPPRRTGSLEPKCLGSNPGSAIDYLCDLGKLLTSLGLSFSICKMGLTKQGDRPTVFRAVPCTQEVLSKRTIKHTHLYKIPHQTFKRLLA